MDETDAMRQHREDREQRRASAKARAADVWAAMTENQKTGVRFGLFPAEVMVDIEKDDRARGEHGRDWLHEVTCGLMDCAAKDGGMRA